jgi:hypothetical protein
LSEDLNFEASRLKLLARTNCLNYFTWYFNRVIDTLKITALSYHKPGIINNYIIIHYYSWWHAYFHGWYETMKSITTINGRIVRIEEMY